MRLLSAFLLFVVAKPCLFAADIKLPVTKNQAKDLLLRIEGAVSEEKPLRLEKRPLPASVKKRLEILQQIESEIRDYVEQGTAQVGFLNWYQEKEMTSEDGKVLLDVGTLTAIFVEKRLRLERAKLSKEDAELIKEVTDEVEFHNHALGEKEIRDLAAEIYAMRMYRKGKPKRADEKSLSDLGKRIAERLESMGGIVSEEWEKGFKDLKLRDEYIRARKGLTSLESVFEHVLAYNKSKEKP